MLKTSSVWRFVAAQNCAMRLTRARARARASTWYLLKSARNPHGDFWCLSSFVAFCSTIVLSDGERSHFSPLPFVVVNLYCIAI